ncbi:MAG: LytTR family DNA-binding domain-containing protein [Marinifilaceae bacterium]|jgi:DNA-binding LytR/AlgR family response regulator|nr:LytTR family DNA-binding domain-containing protein [Marinifilaceae bacterium]
MDNNQKILCAVVEDEHPARELLSDYISKISNLELVGSFTSPLELMDSAVYNDIEILYLDIQMPEITGIDFLKLNKTNPIVIFTTAYSEYALEGYELDVVEYLLKPIAFPRFLKASRKAIKIAEIKRKINSDSFKTIDENIDDKDYIIIKADRKKHKIYYNEIIYIEGALEYVSFHLEDRKITGFYSLKQLEDILPKSYFTRIHRSYIVNNRKIKSLEANTVYLNNIKLPVSSSYKKNIDNIFDR